MIDMHSHILYGVDDGCKTIEDSIAMIEKAIHVGVSDLVLTPHYAPHRGYMISSEEIQKRFLVLEDEVTKLNLPIKLYLGREIDHIEDIIDLLQEHKIETIHDSNYILVDFGMKKASIDEACYEIITQGYIPIIAHPERYHSIYTKEDYKQWKKTGAKIQIDASSLIHSKSRRAMKNARYLLKNNLVDFIASDVHSNEKTYDHFEKALKLCNQETMNRMKNFYLELSSKGV